MNQILVAIRDKLKETCPDIKTQLFDGECDKRLVVHNKFVRIHIAVISREQDTKLVIDGTPIKYGYGKFSFDLKNPNNDINKLIDKIIDLYKSANELMAILEKDPWK